MATRLPPPLPADTPVVLAQGELVDRVVRHYGDLLDAVPGPALAKAPRRGGARHDRQVPVHLGLDQAPKGVINTHRMLVRQPADAASMHALPGARSRRCWWTGCRGTTPSAATTTSASRSTTAARCTSTTASPRRREWPRRCATCARSRRPIYFNVPKGFEEIAARDGSRRAAARPRCSRAARRSCSPAPRSARRCGIKLDAHGAATIGERMRIITGLGMTETAPSCTFAVGADNQSGHIGLPVPGVEVKLVPEGDKTEIRFRGPNVTPGYWRAPEQTRDAFDDEGFYRSGRRGALDRCIEPTARPAVRRPHRRGLQAVHRHLRQRGAAARTHHRGGRSLRAGRGDHRPESRHGRRADLPAARRLPAHRRLRRAHARTRGVAPSGGASALPGDARHAGCAEHRQRQPRWRASTCWPSRRRSTRAS